MNRFSSQDESRLLSCLGQAVSLVNNGHTPDQAIAKVAAAEQVHPDTVPLMVQAFNIGRQTHQREKCANEGVSCLLKEYPIARVENVRQMLYPEPSTVLAGRKSAALSVVSSEYNSPPVPVPAYVAAKMAKVAAAKLDFVPLSTERRYNEFEAVRQYQIKDAADKKIASLRIMVKQAHDEMIQSLHGLKHYLLKECSVPLAEVEYNSRQLFGREVEELFDFVTLGTKSARADGIVPTTVPVDPNKAPYSRVKAALDKTEEYLGDRNVVMEAEQKIASEVAKWIPFGKAAVTETVASPLFAHVAPPYSAVKRAGVLDDFSSTVKQDVRKPVGDLQEGMLDEIDSPGHTAKLKEIHAKAMLADLMANDEVISGYDPDETTSAYNELMQINPRLSQQSAIVRNELRKRLTGGTIEPFDAEVLQKLDPSLRGRASQTANLKQPAAL